MLIRLGLNPKTPKPDFYTAQVFIFAYLGLKHLLSALATKTLERLNLIYLLNTK